MIVIRTAQDNQCKLTHAWAGQVIESVGVVCKDLSLRDATAASLRKELANPDCPNLIAFYGKGLADRLLEHDDETPLVSILEGVLPSELSGKRLYAVACKAGEKLGPSLHAAGCEFVGYTNFFSAPPQFEDEVGEIVNRGLIAWLKGASRESVCKQLEADFQSFIDTVQVRPSKRKLVVDRVSRWEAEGAVRLNLQCLWNPK